MNVFKIESPTDKDLSPLYCKTIQEMYDFEATVGVYLCLPGEDSWMKPGAQVTITVIEMTEEEFDALPEFEGF